MARGDVALDAAGKIRQSNSSIAHAHMPERAQQRLLTSGAITAAALLCTGCSFVFVKAPPADVDDVSPYTSRPCTSSKLAPVLDTVLAGGYAARAVAAAVIVDEKVYERAGVSRELDLGVAAALSTVFVASAVYGYSATASCTQFKRRHEEMQDDLEWYNTHR